MAFHSQEPIITVRLRNLITENSSYLYINIGLDENFDQPAKQIL
jgi:hypothetical protein